MDSKYRSTTRCCDSARTNQQLLNGVTMAIAIYQKQPAEVIDIDIACNEWLPSTDSITEASAVGDAGITVGLSVVDNTQKLVKQWVSGGADGIRYKVTVTITSTEGRVKEADFYVKVKEI